MRIGFLGLGKMGTPMAINLAQKFPLTVWNRTPSKYASLTEAGATIGKTPSDVVAQSDIIFSMLYDGPATAAVVNEDFRRAIRGKTLVNTASVSAEFSLSLAEQIREAGGSFVEMPVSGSKVPAENGQLVGMLAGDAATCESVRPALEPITKAAVYCGAIGSGLKAKYAVNTFLITVTAGLAESMNLARSQGLDLGAVAQVLNEGPMASAYSKLKLDKIVREDWSSQAAINDCFNNTELITAAAGEAGARAPLMKVCNSLYREAGEAGHGEDDMIAVFRVLSGL